MALGAVIGALRAVLSLESAAFEKGLTQAQRGLAGFSAKMSNWSKRMAIAGAAISVPGAAIAVAVRRQIDAMDKLDEASQKFGVPIDQLSRLAYAADMNGVSLDDLGGSLKALSIKMANGSSDFAKWGIAARTADGQLRPTEAVLADIATRMASMPDGAEKTAMAVALLGKSGMGLIPMLNGGGDALKAMGEEAARLGLVIDEKTGKAAGDFNDNLFRLKSVAMGLATIMAANLAPVLADLSAKLVDLAQWFQKLSPAMQRVVMYTAGFTVVTGPMLIALAALARAFGTIVTVLRAIGALMLANPLGLAVTAAVAAAGLIWYNWDWLKQKFTEIWSSIQAGGKAAAEWVQRKWTELKEAVSQIGQNIADSFAAGWAQMRADVAGLVDALTLKWEFWKARLQGLLASVPGLFRDLWATIQAGGAAAADWVLRKWTEAKEAVSKIGQNIADSFAAAWAQMRADVAGLVDALTLKWDHWKQRMETLLMRVPGLFVAMWEKVKAVAAQWVQDFMRIGSDIVEGLKRGISEKWDAMVQWFYDKGAAFQQGFKDLFGIESPSRVFRAFGGFITEGLRLGLADGSDAVMGAIRSLARGVLRQGAALIQGVQAWRPGLGSAFAGVGGDIAAGLKGGIAARWGGMLSWFSGMGQDMVDRFRVVLDSHSPSRVFKGIGGDITDGLQIGIVDGAMGVTGAMQDLGQSMIGLGQGMADALAPVRDELKQTFVDIGMRTKTLGDAWADLRDRLSRGLLSKAFDLGWSAIFGGGGLGGLLANAHGNVFQGGRLRAFASGGVVSAPTYFPMSTGAGLMGEAGPEAIMPLRRMRSGDLGVQMQGGGGAVRIDLAPGLVGSILSQAAGQSIQISQAHGKAAQDALPGTLAGLQARGAF